jgi:hypothetical protein
MVHVTFWLQLLPLLLVLRQSDADCEDFSEWRNEMTSFKETTLKRLTELEHRNENLVSQYYVICCYYDTAIVCSIMLFGYLLCWLFDVSRIQLHGS